mmetsp:Transcript_48889/g.95892  ORF Transcript_48889/g.95892 Transcript_48889/m.95892 type:complete len:96 (-) Transcript_48889:1088-1375(-)
MKWRSTQVGAPLVGRLPRAASPKWGDLETEGEWITCSVQQLLQEEGTKGNQPAQEEAEEAEEGKEEEEEEEGGEVVPGVKGEAGSPLSIVTMGTH